MPLYELGSAFICSTLVAPVMTIMDTAVIRSQYENMNIYKSYRDTIKNYATGRVKCYKPLIIMNGVYFSTYATANVTELYCKMYDVDNKLPTFLITSLVNIVAITYKDRAYIRLFENQTLRFPYVSYGLFAVRDSLTIGSTFVVKKDLVRLLHQEYDMSYNVADLVSSFTIPIITQLFSTPLHILALDVYRRPYASATKRLLHIHQLYSSVCVGRMARMIPSFGVGSYLNDILRSKRYFQDD